MAIVIPCYNETESLPHLAAALARLRSALAGQYQIELLLVDDGSTDDTVTRMQESFDGEPDVTIVRHETNRGIAAAISTGLAHAQAEIVASLDADCTYDPIQLVSMLRLMQDDVDLVVASPYHPQGGVKGVPAWRLGLSRTASRMYRCVLRNKLHTYTSCVRVYRRRSVVDVKLRNDGFVGVVELLWQLDRRGGKVVECPAMLTLRTFGCSKMRVARTMLGHFRLLVRASGASLVGWSSAPLQRTAVRSSESRSLPTST